MIKDYLVKGAPNEVVLGPFIDSTDGITPKQGLVFAASNMKVLLPGAGDFTSILIGGSLIQYDLANGYYRFALITSNFVDAGKMEFYVNIAGALPIRRVFEVRNQYTIRVVAPDGSGTMTPVPGDYLVFEGENFNILGTPTPGLQVTDVAIDGSSVGASTVNNIDDLAPRYYAFQNIGRSARIKFFFAGGA